MVRSRTSIRDRYRDEFYAERLEEKVKERKQREDEPVFEYIAEMQALYKKMPAPPEENKQIRQIYINMRPEYLPLMRSHLHSNLEKFTEHAIELGRAFDAGKQTRQAHQARLKLTRPQWKSRQRTNSQK